ncbi:amidase [Catenulispora rubra]|uniref:amidase n=1 Tax=Catenulispora rubra TaxID=280293 RepID=UPI0018922402|nr:amidase [Catenulispora rubra]
MPDVAFEDWSATDLLDAFRDQRATPLDAADAYLARIARYDASLNSFLTVEPRQVTAAAARSTARYAAGTARPLEGLPIAVKDMIDTAGLRTTYGSAIFRDHVPATDARVITALQNAGAIVLGKTATHEYAWGITTDGHAYRPTRNPWDTARTAGGSSGGSAVAVAARLAPVAIGTDTVGSVRIPAAFCGVIGFKPTFGAIDRGGVFQLAPSLDHVGLIARTVDDVRLLWKMCAQGPPAPTERTAPPDVRIGAYLPPEGPGRLAVSRLREQLNRIGLRTQTIAPFAEDALAVAAVVVGFEGLRVHRQKGLWPTRHAEYEPDVATRLSTAQQLSDGDYASAKLARVGIREKAAEILETFDLIISPVSLAQPLHLDDRSDASRTAFRRQVMSQTALANLIGAPTLTLPVGLDGSGLPLGAQLMAAPGRDGFLLDVAARIAEVTSPSSAPPSVL